MGVVGGEIRCFGGGVGGPWARCRLRRLSVICELVVANALWGQKDYKFLPEFLTLVRENYGGNLQQVDFTAQTEEARKTINAWVRGICEDE